MSKLQWFRLYHRIIDDEKIRLLAFEDRWHFIALCCLKADGLLDEPESSLKERKIAVKLGVQARELDEIRRRLSEVGLIDGNMHPVAWDSLQYVSDTSTERVRKHREKAKASAKKQERNVSVTPPDTDTDTDTEATPSGVAIAPLPEKSDLDRLSQRLCDAADGKMNPTSSLIVGPILEMMAQGVDLETDILPAIRAKASTLKRPVDLRYFLGPIRDAYEARIAAGRGLSRPKTAGKAKGWVEGITDDEARAKWVKTLNFARPRDTWKTWLWGPPPGHEGCLVPADLLEPRDLTRQWFEEKQPEAA